MTITASQKYIRVSPQKLKFVADSIKKLTLTDMKTNLSYMNNESARKILTTLDQAFANAEHNFGLTPEQLILESLLILRGPQYKRQRARSRGQGHPILKRTSHIMIKLKTIDPNAGKVETAKLEEAKVETKPVEVSKVETKKVEKVAVKKVTKTKDKKVVAETK